MFKELSKLLRKIPAVQVWKILANREPERNQGGRILFFPINNNHLLHIFRQKFYLIFYILI